MSDLRRIDVDRLKARSAHITTTRDDPPRADPGDLSRQQFDYMQARLDHYRKQQEEKSMRNVFSAVRRFIARAGLPVILVAVGMLSNALEEVLHEAIDSAPNPNDLKSTVTCVTNKLPQLADGVLSGSLSPRDLKAEIMECLPRRNTDQS